MALTSRDFGSAQLGVAFSTLYTVPTGKKAIIRSLHLTNTLATVVTFRLCLVRSGGPVAANALFWDTEVPARGVLQDDAVHVLEAGGTIQALASQVSALTLTASGAEET